MSLDWGALVLGSLLAFAAATPIISYADYLVAELGWNRWLCALLAVLTYPVALLLFFPAAVVLVLFEIGRAIQRLCRRRKPGSADDLEQVSIDPRPAENMLVVRVQ